MTWIAWYNDFWYLMKGSLALRTTWEKTKELGIWRKDFTDFMVEFVKVLPTSESPPKPPRIGFFR